MGLTINNYLQPGAYSTVIPNPTVATSSGVPVVAIVGQALRGPYTPQLFYNSADPSKYYGTATKANPLSLAIQFAFLNGAPRVLGVNVEPDNSLSASRNILLSSLPVSAYSPAPPSALDGVTLQPVNTNGAIAGTFYVQDFNPVVPDPVLNSTPLASQTAFALAATYPSMLQYVQLLGATQVPLQITQEIPVTVYAVETTTPPVTGITQAAWNQFENAVALMNAINGAFQSPLAAELLIPDSAQTGYNPIPGYRDLYASVGTTLNLGGSPVTPITQLSDAYVYACNHGGILRIYALEPGTQHQIIAGLFDSNTASTSSTDGQSFGIAGQNSGVGNPFIVLQNGSDGVITNNSYSKAINLLGGQRADIVIVLNTDPGIQTLVKNHVTTQSSHDYRNERIAIVSGPISELYTTTIQNAIALQGGPGAQRMMYIYPTAAFYYDLILNTTVVLDGTYLAAACAGILTSHDAAEPLTHKVLAGFQDIAVKLDNPTANSIARNGVCIIENNPNFGIRVRDQLTCDPSTPDTQEISVVRQLDYTAQTLRDLMDANIIATKIVRGTLGVITTMAQNALQSLVDSSIIYGYQGIAARINPNDPRRIDLNVSVRPAYPCKYVEITISVTSSLTGF